jgi:hypothetical protein
MPTFSIKPTHKAVLAYDETLQQYGWQNISHELAIRSAFQNVLAETGKLRKWMLIPVRLVERVVRVSVETVQIVRSLPLG